MGNLDLKTILASQNNKYLYSNDADAEIESALADEITTYDASANITVTADEFTRNMHHLIGGTSTTAFNFTIPATDRPFMVTNDAAHTATVTQGSGTTVDIEAGDSRFLYSGTAGVYAISGGAPNGFLPVTALGAIGGGTQDLDLDVSKVFTAEVDTSATTFTMSNWPITGLEGKFRLYLLNGGSQTVTWPLNVVWPNDTEPTLTTAGTDILEFVTVDGGTLIYGRAIALDLSDVIPSLAGDLFSWGISTVGQIGDNTTVAKSSPVQVGAISTWDALDYGADHSGGVRDGLLFMWGEGNNGGLGDGTTVDKSSPGQIGALTDWDKLSLGLNHGSFVKTDNTLWSFGSGTSGGLGNGAATNQSSPVQVGALTDWNTIACGDNFAASVKTDLTLWTWGAAAFGQLGDGSAVNKSSPVQVGALTDWAQVACGLRHTLAVKTDGTLWAFGAAANGKLGNGTTTPNLSSPVQIGALTDWQEVACGDEFTVACKTDGTLWAFGDSGNGATGQGNTTDISSPVQIGALTDWASVKAGDAHWIAVKTDGSLWSCGAGVSGKLGDGTTVSKSSPVQIGAATDWFLAAAGASNGGGVREV